MEAFAVPDVRSPVHQAVDALVDESIETLSTHALGEDLIDIRQAIDMLEAEFIRRVHRFHRGHGALADGAVSTVSWLRHHCAMTVKAAAYRVHLARTLGELPATLDSARAGRACFSNVAMIAHLAENVGVEQVAPLEHILVGAAETLEPGGMRVLTQATRLRLDPDGVLADANHADHNRWFDCDQTYGGVYVFRGELDADKGALVKTAIDAMSHASPGDTRSASQRRADALVELAALQLHCGDHPDVHGQRPHLTVTVSADTLRSGAAGPPAELRGVGPIHPETARRLACDAVRTVVTVAPSADAWVSTAGSTAALPLSVGRATRTIPAHLRTALPSATRVAAFRGAIAHQRGPTATTSCIGRTAVPPSSTTSSIANTTPWETARQGGEESVRPLFLSTDRLRTPNQRSAHDPPCKMTRAAPEHPRNGLGILVLRDDVRRRAVFEAPETQPGSRSRGRDGDD
jgi:hypothetical protein